MRRPRSQDLISLIAALIVAMVGMTAVAVQRGCSPGTDVIGTSLSGADAAESGARTRPPAASIPAAK